MIKEIKTQEEFTEIMHSDYADNVEWCPHCGRAYLIDWTKEEKEAMMKWSNRELLIQDALPNRDVYERELMRFAWSGLPMLKCCEECDGGVGI